MRIQYFPQIDENRASSRFRQIIPGSQLEILGHTVYFDQKKHNAEWLIVNKAVQGAGDWTGHKKVCFDMCDNHFITIYREDHIKAIERADLVTCSTPTMAMEIKEETGREAVVIEDPVDLGVISPVNVNQLDSIFWCGNSLSAPALMRVGVISDEYDPWVDDRDSVITIGGEQYNLFAVGVPEYDWSASYTKRQMIDALDCSDVCIIPVDNNRWGRCKSPNRLMDAVARGKFVIAEHMPAYEPFSEWMFIGNIQEGLSWAKQNLTEIPERVRLAQDYIIKNHSAQQIGEKWETALSNSI